VESFTVDQAGAGARLDRRLTDRLPELSRARLQALSLPVAAIAAGIGNAYSRLTRRIMLEVDVRVIPTISLRRRVRKS
jgi:hypothetical protein